MVQIPTSSLGRKYAALHSKSVAPPFETEFVTLTFSLCMIAAPIFVLVIEYTGFQGCRVAGAILPSSATESSTLARLLRIRIAAQCRIRIGNIMCLPRDQRVLLSDISRPAMLDFGSYFISLNMPDFRLQSQGFFRWSCHFVETSMAKKANKPNKTVVRTERQSILSGHGQVREVVPSTLEA